MFDSIREKHVLRYIPRNICKQLAFYCRVEFTRSHHNDVIMSAMASQITSLTSVLLNRLFKAQIKENIKAARHWLLWGEFTGDRWIPRKKGQYRGKCFHLMTSSWIGVASLALGQSNHGGNSTIASVPVYQPWGIWVNGLHESTRKLW